MKIVVAVDRDKQTIVKKTGQAAFFAIFENEKLVDFVKNSHEHIASHKKDITGLAGCDVILVQAVGEHMKEALLSIGLKVKKIRKKDGVTAKQAVRNYLDIKE